VNCYTYLSSFCARSVQRALRILLSYSAKSYAFRNAFVKSIPGKK
jgi:hypothetical protein